MPDDKFWQPYGSMSILIRKFIPDIKWTITLSDSLRMKASIKKHIIFFRRRYLRREITTARAIISHMSTDGVIYDIGANIGLYTLLFAENRQRTVVSFEPSNAVIPLLLANIALNGLSNVQIQQALLSDHCGSCKFTHDKITTCASHISAPGEPGDVCECWDLDSYINAKNLPPPNIIKLDVEGHDIQILRGMRGTLERYRPLVYLEGGIRTENGEVAAIPYLEGLGFAVWDVTKTRRVQANTADYDFLAFPT